MRQIVKTIQKHALLLMALTGTVGIAVVLMMRVVLTPTLRNSDTGRFATNVAAAVAGIAVVVLLGILALMAPKRQSVITGNRAMPVALGMLLCGAVVAVSSAWDAVLWLVCHQLPAPDATVTVPLLVVTALMLLCGLTGGISLIVLGFQVAAQGGIRKGMRAISCLLPVLWMCFRLARYEMSYSSAVNPANGFFIFTMFIFEILFLFKLARLVSGVGEATDASSVFCAMGTAVFAFGGFVFRIVMQLMGEEALAQSSLVFLSDGVLGLLALAVGWAIALGNVSSEQSESSAEESQA